VSDRATNGDVDISTRELDGFEIETSRHDMLAFDPEDDHAPHQKLASVLTGSSHLPLRPDAVVFGDGLKDLGAYVRNRAKDLDPILSNLIAALESPLGVGWGLIDIGRVKAGNQGIEVVVVRRLHQPVDNRRRIWPQNAPLSQLGQVY
jgi:hypothetical protein